MIFVNGRFIFVSRPNWTLCRIVRKQSHYYVKLFKCIKKKKKINTFQLFGPPMCGFVEIEAISKI